jgi:hypothetical protein
MGNSLCIAPWEAGGLELDIVLASGLKIIYPLDESVTRSLVTETSFRWGRRSTEVRSSDMQKGIFCVFR